MHTVGEFALVVDMFCIGDGSDECMNHGVVTDSDVGLPKRTEDSVCEERLEDAGRGARGHTDEYQEKSTQERDNDNTAHHERLQGDEDVEHDANDDYDDYDDYDENGKDSDESDNEYDTEGDGNGAVPGVCFVGGLGSGIDGVEFGYGVDRLGGTTNKGHDFAGNSSGGARACACGTGGGMSSMGGSGVGGVSGSGIGRMGCDGAEFTGDGCLGADFGKDGFRDGSLHRHCDVVRGLCVGQSG